jgi:hypothetical protein
LAKRAGRRLSVGRSGLEVIEFGKLALEVLEVVGIRGAPEDLVDHRAEVGEGADRFEGQGIRRSETAADGSQDHSGTDHTERNTVVEEPAGEAAIRGPDMPEGAWSVAVQAEHRVHVLVTAQGLVVADVSIE